MGAIRKEPVVYVEQFEAFWALTLNGAFTLLQDIAHGRMGDLDRYGERLAARPKCIRGRFDRDDVAIYSSKHVLWRMPCDWQYGDDSFIEARTELDDLAVRVGRSFSRSLEVRPPTPLEVIRGAMAGAAEGGGE